MDVERRVLPSVPDDISQPSQNLRAYRTYSDAIVRSICHGYAVPSTLPLETICSYPIPSKGGWMEATRRKYIDEKAAAHEHIASRNGQ